MKISSTQLDFSQDLLIIAGPCSIESFEHLKETADFLHTQGVSALRGGAYKLRTQHESFQGKREEAFRWIKDLKKLVNLSFVSEVTDPRQIEGFLDCVDIFQVGTRNMYNYEMLKELGKTSKPVILKRAFSALVKEWLGAADYIAHSGNDKIILCERGIRTFETTTRNTLDLNSVVYLKQNCPFPVIVDPSHGTGVSSLVTPMSLASLACGADGLLIEVHPEPSKALSDGDQSLNFKEFENLMNEVRLYCDFKGKKIKTLPHFYENYQQQSL